MRTTEPQQGKLAAAREPKKELKPAARPPWANSVPEVEGASLRPAQEFFLGVVLMLQRTPAKVRASNFPVEVQRWAAAIADAPEQSFAVRADVAEGPATDERVHDVSSERSFATAERLPARQTKDDVLGDRYASPPPEPEIREARAEHQTRFDVADPVVVDSAPAAAKLTLDQRPDPKREPDVQATISAFEAEDAASSPESIAVNNELPVLDEPAESTQQQNMEAASEADATPNEIFLTTEEPLAASPEQLSSPACEVAETETTGEWIETELGGLFYLINLGLFLGLYGDFTSPDERGLKLSIWEFIRLIGKDLLQKPARQQELADGQPSSTSCVPLGALPNGGASAPAFNYEDDAVWALLTGLDQREDGNEEGGDFEPSDEWRVPPEWLHPFAEETTRPWLWSASVERLRLFHPAGFAVLDLPRSQTTESPAAQLERELRAYASLALQGSNFELIKQPDLATELETRKSKLETWLGRLLPYLRARLRKALGLAETAEPGPLLCRQRAQVCVTPTHVDLFFRLADLPIEIRRSGLDRDPGWVPAAGRFIAFHFE